MKHRSIFALMAIAILAMILITQCKKDNTIEMLEETATSGKDVINTMSGNWTFDKAHSNVNWETMYYNDNALLTGKFQTFKVDINFMEDDLDASQIDAWVQLSTFLTGEPGRDSPGKCGPNYMGVEYLDTLYTVDPTTDTAWFKSTSIEKYGNGYLAKGDFTFKGVTKQENLYFKYMGQKDYSTDPGNPNVRGGFTGQFTIIAPDYNVNSSSIADEVTIKVNANYRKQ